MSGFQESGHQDPILVQYLVGLLPVEDAVRLDELSVTDDDVAWRLYAAENDLVDAYVSGTLTGAMLDRFESNYLASARRSEKVRIARGLLRRVQEDDRLVDSGQRA